MDENSGGLNPPRTIKKAHGVCALRKAHGAPQSASHPVAKVHKATKGINARSIGTGFGLRRNCGSARRRSEARGKRV